MTTIPIDPQRWSDYSAPLRALLDEYARALRDMEAVLHRVTPAQYMQATTLSDKEFPDMAHIMEHVIACIHGYIDYIDDGLDQVDRGRRPHPFTFATPAEAVAAMWQAFDGTATGLARIKQFTDEDMEKVEFPTRWKQRFDIEQMLEHAIVHILRHRRQLERWRAAMA